MKPTLKLPRKRRFLSHTLVMMAGALLAAGGAAKAAPDAPFLTSAYDAAIKNPTNPGLSATVTMTTLGAASSGPKVVVAQGPLLMEGDLLGGRLPMTFSDAGAAPKGENSLFFNVTKSGRIGLQWLLNDKPLDGKSMQAFDTDVAGTTLTKKLNWNGVYRLVTVSVERKRFMVGQIRPFPRPGRVFVPGVAAPTPTPKPMIIVGGIIKIKPKATGRRVRVTGRFVVTNSDDGVGGIWGSADKEVEMAGLIQFGNQTAFSFTKKSARETAEFSSKNMESVTLNYSDPDFRFFKVSGNIRDIDTASAADTMWTANERIDLIKIMESNQEYVIRGDRKSESGDLYIRVVDEGEVF